MKKCFAECHISETTDEDDTDNEDRLRLTELIQLVKPHRTRLVASVREYVDIDNDANIVHENDGDDWEQKLLDDLSASSTRQQDDPSDSDDHDTDETLDPCPNNQLFKSCTIRQRTPIILWAK